MRTSTAALLVCVAAARTASADVATGDESARAWHGGANLRTDLGAHRVRAGIGLRFGPIDTTVVLDPKVFIDGRQNDSDLLLEWYRCPGGWAALLGWRLSQVSIDRGHHYHEHLLVGVSGPMPPLLDRHVRSRFGLEIETTVVRHGSGIETDVISFSSERHWRDLVSINLFARLEFASPM
jgi:hypothetical protein